MTRLPSIRKGLLKHPLENQMLVYDTRVDRVHLLDATTACVLELLEEGGHSADGIARQIAARLDVIPDEGFLALAIDELRKADLFDDSAAVPEPLGDVSRRDVLRKIAVAGSAAFLVPAIASLTATPGYAQGTAPNRGNCNTCASASQCISGNCCNGICLASCTGGAVGQCCNLPGQCASGVCTGGFCAQGSLATGASCTSASQCASNQCCHAASAAASTATCKVSGCHVGGDNVAGAGGCTGNNNPPFPTNTCCSGDCDSRSGGPGGTCSASTCLA